MKLHEDFQEEFTELLKKYNAKFDIITYTVNGESEDSPVIKFATEFSTGKITREYSEMKLLAAKGIK